tara:strand:+ start:42 stop:1280 length:1239 start_codon:yes stop_codon:yes gene_type:complete
MSEIKSESITLVDIDSIIPNPKNANRHSIEQIKRLEKLITYQGFRNPLIVSNRTGFLIVGHGRLEAAINLGLEKLPVIYQDFIDEAQEYAYLISDNEIARWAELDKHLVYTELKDLDLEDIELLGLEDFELPDIDVLDPQTDEDEVPEVTNPITKLGDVWHMGEHRLMCGDSTDVNNVAALVGDKILDVVFTDPPYNQVTSGGEKGNIGASLRKQSADIEHLCDFNPEEFLNTLPTAFINKKMNAYVFCNKDLVVDYLKFARDNGFSYNILFWKKPNAIPLGGSHRPDVEYLLIFRKSGIFNGGIKDVSYSKCLEHSRELSKDHPTLKPIELIENQLQIASNMNGYVMDFFLGSGSTMIACEKQSRRCIGLELSEKYCDVIINRWQNYTGKTATLESTGELYNDLKAVQDGN